MTYFMSFKNGMQTLSQACADYIGKDSIRLGAGVKAVEPKGKGYSVILENGEALDADYVMIGAAAYDAAEMVKGFDATLATQMNKIEWSSSATVSIAFKKDGRQGPAQRLRVHRPPCRRPKDQCRDLQLHQMVLPCAGRHDSHPRFRRRRTS